MLRVAIESRKQHDADAEMDRLVPVPLGAIKWTLRMSRDTWPEKTGRDVREREVIFGRISISYDGGLTYATGAGVGAPGGVTTDHNGKLMTEVTISSGILQPRNGNRVARVRFKSNDRLTTKIDLDFD